LGGEDQEDCGSRPAWEKSYQDPISTNKPGKVMHAWNPSYMGDVGRRIVVQCWLGKNHKILSKKKTTKAKKRLGAWLKW
jgi:hypothetical protein